MSQLSCARSSLVNNHTIEYQAMKCSEISTFANAKPDCKDHTGPSYSSLKACLVGRNWSKDIWFKSDSNKVPAKLNIVAWPTSVNNISPDKNYRTLYRTLYLKSLNLLREYLLDSLWRTYIVYWVHLTYMSDPVTFVSSVMRVRRSPLIRANHIPDVAIAYLFESF